jgi:uncharacterized protein (TIGR03437 family)
VRIANNLFQIDGPRFGSNGAFATVINGTDQVTIENNTAIQTGSIIITDYLPNTGFIFRNNINRHNEYGMIGSGHSMGNDTLSFYFPGSIVTTNLIAKEIDAPWNVDLIYPAGNLYPASLDAIGFVDWRNGNYSLGSSSPYKGAGTGGIDPGCNMDALNAALNGTAPPPPTPTPTPLSTPTPTPTPVSTPTPTPTPTPTLSVSISSPTNNSTFSLGSNITVSATASDVGCTIASVEFSASSQIIGTATAKPYSTVWSNPVAGTYGLTAKAWDSCNHTVTSGMITVKVSKALKSVRNNRKNATQLATSESISVSGDTFVSTAALDSFVANLQQTYNDFAAERSLFNSSALIDRYLFAAMFLAQTSDALTRVQTPNSGVVDRLNKVDAYLSFCEDLMVSDAISQQSLTSATQVNVRADLPIMQASTSNLATTDLMVSPNSGARVLTTSTIPFGSQTLFSLNGTPQYELGDLTVTVNGRAAQLLVVSPNQINFTVPSGTAGGLAEIVVTSREGYICHGTAAVTGLNPMIFGRTGDASGLGAILDAVGLQSGTFGITGNSPFLPDSRTRLTILTSGISTGVANTNRANDVWLNNGQVIVNLAEAVTVEARTSDNRVIMLPVEFAGAQGSLAGLDQVNVVLVPGLTGSVQLTLVVNGVRSNTMNVTLQ